MIIAIAEAMRVVVLLEGRLYAAIEMTRVGPAGAPSSTADGNTENACTNDRQKQIARPGASSGR